MVAVATWASVTGTLTVVVVPALAAALASLAPDRLVVQAMANSEVPSSLATRKGRLTAIRTTPRRAVTTVAGRSMAERDVIKETCRSGRPTPGGYESSLDKRFDAGPLPALDGGQERIHGARAGCWPAQSPQSRTEKLTGLRGTWGNGKDTVPGFPRSPAAPSRLGVRFSNPASIRGP